VIKKSPLLLELEYFKDILSRHRQTRVNKIEDIKKDEIGSMEKQLIFEHMVEFSLCECCKMDGSKLGEGMSRVKAIEKKETEKIKRFKNYIEQENCPRCREVH
jgi:hypothetical protein